MKFRLLPHWKISQQKGGALFVLLAIVGIVAVLLVGTLTRKSAQIEGDKQTAAALAQAKDALIGYAITYRDNGNPNDVWGFLPLPDVGNGLEGQTEPTYGSQDISIIGRLPWKTLALPPLRDGAGECLWYAVSGRFKASPKTAVFNWDTAGQLDIMAENGLTISIPNAVAVVLGSKNLLGGQDRTAAANTSVCGGNYDALNYLDPYNPADAVSSVVNYFGSTNHGISSSTANQRVIQPSASGFYNDALLVITADDIFKRIKQRSDFKSDIDTMMADLVACLNAMPAASLPAAAGSKGIDGPLGNPTVTACLGIDTKKTNIRSNWNENLLYAKLPTPAAITINGAASPNPCAAVLIFGGERTARAVAPLVAQTRALSTEKSDATMYLEGVNASSFPGGTAYSGISAYTATNASADVVACITGTGGGTTVSFSDPSQFSKFEIAGAGVTVDPTSQTATIDVAGGSGGGCFWFPDTMTLNGKILRSYYEFKFTYPDPPGGSDYGYGFTLSFLEGDAGKPTTCGSQSTMGVIPSSTLPFSLFVETDIHQGGNSLGEPNGTPNHTAIMANGNTAHSATNGNLTTACNGTAAGCNYSLSNKFEESPATLLHNQRVEIHSGYNSTCTASGGTYSLVKVWVDCTACNNTGSNFTASAPTVTRCISLDSSMNNIYFGFTAGFASSGGQVQGVTLRKLELRVE